MKYLKTPYLKVETKQGESFGGNQAWFPYKFLQKTGCGVVSASDVLLHLKGKTWMTQAQYVDFAKKIWLYYLPVIPGFGMNALTLTVGMNRYFLNHGMPYRAVWNVTYGKMHSRINQMLDKDCPVIMAVGPNFPVFWGKEKLNFYVKNADGSMIPVTKISGHFVTVTGREGGYLQISSWGKQFFIDTREFKKYIRKYSCPLFSNVIYLQHKK